MRTLTWRKSLLTLAAGLYLAVPALAADSTAAESGFSGVMAVYEANRKEGLPNYVTQDLYLVAYQDLSRQELQHREVAAAGGLENWLEALRQAAAERTGEGQQAAGDLVDVLATLVGDQPELSEVAQAELALVEAAEGLAESPLWGSKVDYSQFTPRGRYTEDETSQQYFRQVRYLNSTLFHVNASKATGVTDEIVARHMAMLQELLAWGAAGDSYQALLEVTALMGSFDDLTLLDVEKNENEDLAAGLRDFAGRQRRYPIVLQGYVERTALDEGETAPQALLGVRLLPGTVTADTIAMQALVNEAGAWTGKGEQPFSAAAGGTGIVKGWPTANEVLAAMGVSPAVAAVAGAGDNAFVDYDKAMASAIHAFADLSGLELLNWALHRAVATSRDDTASALITTRALWTLQRHEHLLYAKQSYTMVDRGMPPMVDRSQSTIEPAVAVYVALAQLIDRRVKLAPEGFAEKWQAFADLLKIHTDLARKVESGEALTPEEGDQLADIDLALKQLGVEPDKPVVVDVHTHPGEGQVLQEATAHALVVEHEGARGAHLSHREFKQPIGERLTDEAWRKSLTE